MLVWHSTKHLYCSIGHWKPFSVQAQTLKILYLKESEINYSVGVAKQSTLLLKNFVIKKKKKKKKKKKRKERKKELEYEDMFEVVSIVITGIIWSISTSNLAVLLLSSKERLIVFVILINEIIMVAKHMWKGDKDLI